MVKGFIDPSPIGLFPYIFLHLKQELLTQIPDAEYYLNIKE